MTDESLDLTDTWHGRYCYPKGLPPVPFVARLEHSGNRLFGTVEEPTARFGADAPLAGAAIDGRVAGGAVTFLKIYDRPTLTHTAVRYSGRVGDGGLEISGIWVIPGHWSGTFIMIRSRGLYVPAEKADMQQV